MSIVSISLSLSDLSAIDWTTKTKAINDDFNVYLARNAAIKKPIRYSIAVIAVVLALSL